VCELKGNEREQVWPGTRIIECNKARLRRPKFPFSNRGTSAQRKLTPQPELETEKKEKRVRPYQQRQLQRRRVRFDYSSSCGSSEHSYYYLRCVVMLHVITKKYSGLP